MQQPFYTDYNNQTPPSYGQKHYPNQRFIPNGAPVQGFCTYSPQQYTFVPGIGFVRRSPEDEERRQIAATSRKLAAAMLTCLVLLYLTQPAATFFATRISGLLPFRVSLEAIGLLSTIMSYLAAFIFPFVIYQARVGIPAKAAYPLRRPRVWLVVCATLILLGICTIASFSSDVLDALLQSVGLYASQSNAALPSDTFGIVLYIVLYVVLSPLVEELLFRGLIMQSLRRFGDGVALLCSSVLFALVHPNILMLPYAFLTGLVIGYFVLRSGSVVTGIVMHLANNLLLTIYHAAAKGLTPTWSNIVMQGIFIVFIVAALFAVKFAVRRDENIFSLAPARMALSFKGRIRALCGSGVMVVYFLVTAWFIISSIRTVFRPW